MQLFKTRDVIIVTNGESELLRGHIKDTCKIKKRLEQISFLQRKIKMFGKVHNIPRLEAWYSPYDYTYSNTTLKARSFPMWLLKIKDEVESISNEKFNSVLICKYIDGAHYVGYHQDNESLFGFDPIIASLSIGETRKFRFRNKFNPNLKKEILLEDGDILIMGKGMQINWEHELPKTKSLKGVRYCLTWRYSR